MLLRRNGAHTLILNDITIKQIRDDESSALCNTQDYFLYDIREESTDIKCLADENAVYIYILFVAALNALYTLHEMQFRSPQITAT